MSTLAVDEEGVYRPCPGCEAPLIFSQPFPASWHFDMIKEGPRTGPVKVYFTPHNDQCALPIEQPEPGASIRIEGEHMAAVRFAMDQ